MSISDTKTQKRDAVRISFLYLLASLFCVLFGAVYECFSHDVYSAYMIYAFVFPLAGGTLPFLALSLYGHGRLPGRLPLGLYNAGIAALTAGSIMEGVLEIYGTTNDLLQVYWFAGFGLAGTGLLIYLANQYSHKKSKQT